MAHLAEAVNAGPALASHRVPSLQRTFVGAASALAAIAVAAFVLSYGYQNATAWLFKSRDVARIARDVRTRTLQWDSHVRGYVLSGDEDALSTAGRQRAAVYVRLDSLDRLAADNVAQKANAVAIRRALNQWDAMFGSREAATVLYSTRTRDSALARSAFLDTVQSAQEAFINAEDARFASRLASVQRWQRNISLAVIAAVLLVAIALRALRIRLISDAKRDLALQQQLEDQAAELHTQAAQLAIVNTDLQGALTVAQKSQGELLHAAEEHRDLLRSISDVIAVMHRDGTYVRLEASTPGLTTRAPHQLIGANIRDTLSPAVVATMLDAFEKAIREGHPVRYEYEIEADQRTLAFEAVASPMGDDRLLCVARNVTEHRRADSQLRQAQKMEAIGRLAGGVAHDFNNMLAVIMSYASMIAEEVGAESPLHADLREISGAADRAASLTRQLLAFSRKQMLQPTVLDLNESVSDIEKMLRRLTNPDIQFAIHLDPMSGFVRADRGQLDQVFVNLVVNASDAMPDGGTLTIETRDADLDEHAAHLLGIPAAGTYVMLTVRDTGVGMTKDTIAQIFEPFFTTKGVGRGTGLGLATVYGIVKQSGGHVTVMSEVGKGTTFCIFLPRLEVSGDRTRTQHVPDPLPRGTGCILLVEDEEAVRRVTLRALQRAGYQVLEAENGRGARDVIDNAQCAIDLVITDMLMPGMGGVELAQSILAKGKDTRVLFISGYSREQIVPDELMRPGVSFMPKPFTSNALLTRVNEMLSSSVAA